MLKTVKNRGNARAITNALGRYKIEQTAKPGTNAPGRLVRFFSRKYPGYVPNAGVLSGVF